MTNNERINQMTQPKTTCINCDHCELLDKPVKVFTHRCVAKGGLIANPQGKSICGVFKKVRK